MAKVLIVEDDTVMLKMYSRVFGYEGFEVVLASDGVDGLEKAKKEKPDIILLDIMLPKMSGLQVLDQLKADPTTQGIPVVAFSNLAGKQDMDAVLSKGAVRFVSKSQVTPKQVTQVIQEELNRLGKNGTGGPQQAQTTGVSQPAAVAPQQAQPSGQVAPQAVGQVVQQGGQQAGQQKVQGEEKEIK